MTSGTLHLRLRRDRLRVAVAGSPTAPRSLVIVLVLIVIWYVAAILMNMTLVRDAFEREETAYTLVRPHRRHPRCRAAAGARAAPDRCCSSSTSCSAIRRIRRAASSITPGSRSRRPSSASRSARVRHPARRADRACAHAGKEPAAVDHLLADGADPRGRADHHRGARLDRPARAAAEIADLGLSVLLPGHDRHGEGPDLAGPDPARPHAHLVGDAGAGVVEAALAGLGAVPVREPQGRDHRSRWSAPSSRSCRPAPRPASARACWPAPITARPCADLGGLLAAAVLLAAILVGIIGWAERWTLRRMGAKP